MMLWLTYHNVQLPTLQEFVIDLETYAAVVRQKSEKSREYVHVLTVTAYCAQLQYKALS